METLFGSYDENLKHLESRFNVRIRTQGHELLVDGDEPGPQNVDRVVRQLASRLMREGYKLSTSDVKTASELVAQDQSVDLRRAFPEGQPASRGKSASRRRRSTSGAISRPSTPADIVFGIGPRAQARPICAMAQAVSYLVAKR